MSRQSRSKVELIQLGSANIATSIYGHEKKKIEIIETLNSVNRHKRRLLHVFLATPHGLTSPLPEHLPKFLPSGAWGPGETKMAHGALLVQLTSNESTDSARTQLDLSVQ